MEDNSASTFMNKSISSNIKKQVQPESKEVDSFVSNFQNHFSAFRNIKHEAFLKRKLEECYGKNFPINYRESYGFE
jgi:hypothetical protein